MSPIEIAAAEEAVRELIGGEVADLVRPVLRPEHMPVIEMIERLPWDAEHVDRTAVAALKLLKGVTRPGGPIDPSHDDADVPWATTIVKMIDIPSVGSNMARTWYRHGLHLLLNDVEVSTVGQAMAAYGVARCEEDLGHHHEVARWIMIAGVESEIDDREGVGLAVVLRAARLLRWGTA